MFYEWKPHQPSPDEIAQFQAAVEEKGWRGPAYWVACVLYYGTFTIVSLPLYQGFGFSRSDSPGFLVLWLAAFIMLDVLTYRRKAERLDAKNWIPDLAAGKQFFVGTGMEAKWKLWLFGLNVLVAVLVAMIAGIYGETKTREALLALGLGPLFAVLFLVLISVAAFWPTTLPSRNTRFMNPWHLYEHSGHIIIVCGCYVRGVFLLVYLPIYLFCLILMAHLNLHDDMLMTARVGVLQIGCVLVVTGGAALPHMYKAYAIARSIHRSRGNT